MLACDRSSYGASSPTPHQKALRAILSVTAITDNTGKIREENRRCPGYSSRTLSANNDKAVELRDWVEKNSWDDVLLDLDRARHRGVAASGRVAVADGHWNRR